jgi:hypothetical protein
LLCSQKIFGCLWNSRSLIVRQQRAQASEATLTVQRGRRIEHQLSRSKPHNGTYNHQWKGSYQSVQKSARTPLSMCLLRLYVEVPFGNMECTR